MKWRRNYALTCDKVATGEKYEPRRILLPGSMSPWVGIFLPATTSLAPFELILCSPLVVHAILYDHMLYHFQAMSNRNFSKHNTLSHLRENGRMLVKAWISLGEKIWKLLMNIKGPFWTFKYPKISFSCPSFFEREKCAGRYEESCDIFFLSPIIATLNWNDKI